jgi:hypothetical protein
VLRGNGGAFQVIEAGLQLAAREYRESSEASGRQRLARLIQACPGAPVIRHRGVSVREERLELSGLERPQLAGPVPLRKLELELESECRGAFQGGYARPRDTG